MELGCIPQKMDEPSLGFHGLSRLVSKNIVSDVPEMINFFSYCIKKNVFLSSPKGTPTTGAVEQWEKPTLQWKPMELGGVPQKKGWIVFKKMSFSSSPKVTPTTGVAEQWTKNCFAMKTNGIRWRSSKMDEPSPGFHGFSRSMSKNLNFDWKT